MFQLRKLSGIASRIYQTQSISATLTQVPRCFHEEFTVPPLKTTKIQPKTVPTAVASKYQLFKDDDASVILDIEEERQRLTDDTSSEETLPDIYAGLNLERNIRCNLCIFGASVQCYLCVTFVRWQNWRI